MAAEALPSAEDLRQLLIYEPDTGKLFWRERPQGMFSCERDCRAWNARYAGREAFTPRRGGYLMGKIFSRTHSAHRVIWCLFFGAWPSKQIDHINGDRSDNRIGNLREVSHTENMRNQKLHITNSSGHAGVYWMGKDRVWRASIWRDGRRKYLGSFVRKDDAVRARLRAEQEFGFHQNHGRR